jgi:hypothetical protein
MEGQASLPCSEESTNAKPVLVLSQMRPFKILSPYLKLVLIIF